MVRAALFACFSIASIASAQTTFFDVGATQNFEDFGSSLCVGGDYDADGVADLIVGASSHDLLTAGDAGAIFLLSGADGSVLRTLLDPITGGQLGRTVADAGDVDGDGVSDVLGGSPFHFTPSEYAKVWSGATGAVLRTYSIGTSNAWFGAAVANAGDVDGDGRDDHLVGAYQSDLGFSNAGALYVYSGATGALVRTHIGLASEEFEGLAVTTLGDVDLDGRADYAVSAPKAVVLGMPDCGRVEVRSGATGNLIRSFVGSTANAWYGFALAAAGDLDGDGVSELAIGASPVNGGFPIVLYPGYVTIVSVVTGGVIRTLNAPDCADVVFGRRLSRASDYDGDGVADLIVTSTSSARVFSGASGAQLTYVHDLATDVGYGYPLTSAWLPDVSGDGRPELVAASQRPGFLRAYADPSTPEHTSTFCFGDGSSGPCPCGNLGASGEGCANSTGHGARLSAFGLPSVSDDKLWLRGDGFPINSTTILFAATSSAAPAPLFDGLRCTGGGSRAGLQKPCGAGSTWYGPGIAETLGWTGGSTIHFQVYYRNAVGSPCGTSANLSSAISVALVP